MDKELDQAEREFDEVMLDFMERKENPLQGYLHLVIIARMLERVGDHSKNICEDLIFIEEARDIRYRKDKRAEVHDAGALI